MRSFETSALPPLVAELPTEIQRVAEKLRSRSANVKIELRVASLRNVDFQFGIMAAGAWNHAVGSFQPNLQEEISA